MSFAEGMTASNQRYGLLVIHRHPSKRVANVARRKNRRDATLGSAHE
jgi:hypothetical protein